MTRDKDVADAQQLVSSWHDEVEAKGLTDEQWERRLVGDPGPIGTEPAHDNPRRRAYDGAPNWEVPIITAVLAVAGNLALWLWLAPIYIRWAVQQP
jgi:hypothetical protein